MLKKIVLLIINFTWELPQTIIGAIFFLIFYPFRDKIEADDEHLYLYVFKSYPGMSLGRFILLMKRPEKNYKYFYKGMRRDHVDLVNHERGHSMQSRILGPFYLLIIFPSGLWFVFTSIVELILKRRFADYYWFYTESWADILGKVKHRSVKATPTKKKKGLSRSGKGKH
jgi:hypothetical protein